MKIGFKNIHWSIQIILLTRFTASSVPLLLAPPLLLLLPAPGDFFPPLSSSKAGLSLPASRSTSLFRLATDLSLLSSSTTEMVLPPSLLSVLWREMIK